MSILSLPDELILLIAAEIDSEGQISKLLRTNQRLKSLLLPYLYRRNAECSDSSALLHCCLHGNQQGLESFLRWKEELKTPDRCGHSPVHLAARNAVTRISVPTFITKQHCTVLHATRQHRTLFRTLTGLLSGLYNESICLYKWWLSTPLARKSEHFYFNIPSHVMHSPEANTSRQMLLTAP
jgi:hypothetical protein